MFWYAISSLTPAALLGLACVLGGVFPALAVLSITAFVFFLDKLSMVLPQTSSDGRGLTVTLALTHFVLLILGVWALSGPDRLDLTDKLLIFTGLGLFFGQISNSNAHELIHAKDRMGRRLGAAVYISLLHGHHVSAHLRVHHIYAGTKEDPNTARPGEGFWAYALRAMAGEFTAGLRAETAHRSRSAKSRSAFSHPYILYVAGAVLALSGSFVIGSAKGMMIFLALVLYAQLQLLLSDYVQHYGLQRVILPNGKPEPMAAHHSWNAPKWYSSAMMLNAPKHSDHHIHPARAFPDLRVTPETMPVLPHSLPVMAVLALVPPLWRKIMDRRAKPWQETA